MTTIRVELINAATSEPLGEGEFPIEQLPESFATSTTLHLGNGDWHVEQAEPGTRAEFAASGRLRLVVRKVELVDPKTILFSLPTLESVLPPVAAGDTSEAFAMHEDDWRQVELVTARFEPEIAAELAAIREVFADRKDAGFTRLHVRERIAQPLETVQLAIDDVQMAIGMVRPQPLALAQQAIVVGGFAYTFAGAVYGRAVGDEVVVLGFARDTDPTPFAALAQQHSLLLVDWCRARILRSDGVRFD